MSIRKLMLVAFAFMTTLVLVACETTVQLTSIMFEGTSNVEVPFGEPFNVLTGVRAKGNDGKYYDDEITFTSLAVAKGDLQADGTLNTSTPQAIEVKYTVQVGAVKAETFRQITVLTPEPTGDAMIQNGDFSQGLSFWNNPAVNYVADGAAMQLSVEDGALKVEMTVGANAWTPRFGQDGITFEQGKTYEVSFKAKANDPKKINLQVGELLPSDPYFNDFKPGQTIYKDITTSWATYSYKFTMGKPTNTKGAILFELGTVNQNAVSTTIYFDDIKVEEATADPDTEGPVLSGIIAEQNITVGSTFNPLAGVTAYDVGEAKDYTAEIEVTIFDEDDNEVDSVDTSTPGQFRIVYFVEDTLGNESEEESIVNVVDLLFGDNLFAELNSDFTKPIAEDDTWTVWYAEGGPQVNVTQDTTEGSLTLDITGGGEAAWAVQLTKPETQNVELKQGHTYKFVAIVSAEVARSMNVAIGHGQWVEYGRKDGLQIGTTATSIEFIFTVTQPTHVVRFTFELGNQPGFADGEVTFHHVGLHELTYDFPLTNSDFAISGWRGFYNSWEGSEATFGIEDGQFAMHITKFMAGGEGWKLQIMQDVTAFGGDTEVGVLELEPNTTYLLKFDMYASQPMTVNPLVANPSNWANFILEADRTVNLTTGKQTFILELTTPAEVNGEEVLKFEFGGAFASFEEGLVSIFLDNVSITKQGEGNQPIASVYNGTMDQPYGWNFFAEGNSMTWEPGKAVITVTTLGAEAYIPHFYQEGITLAAGEYTLVLQIKSSVSRDLRVNLVLPNEGFSSMLEGGSHDFAVTADTVHTITINFTVSVPKENIKFELDFGTLGGDLTSLPGTFEISQVFIYPNF
ncbi:carbohydrate binding domain-containing protein [Acholeplasma equirhinis]|uniref:carbohydrate binding domain-containing protein n=1 Tax=Acholeplasma equirhinis TaxID=555393 RepID=UPI00197A91A7|nr:carbohydrate binding domain-containing protein [Acholeplasma equirhinis]MBN3490405.1 carbohydrate binding domain-containing protein [Acholeplasma equirhinis]